MKPPEEVTREEYDVRKAVLGIDAESFKRTNLGKYVFDRIVVEEKQIIEELIAADPGDLIKNTKLRADIAMHRMLPKFMNEAIAAGHMAERNIRNNEDQKDF